MERRRRNQKVRQSKKESGDEESHKSSLRTHNDPTGAGLRERDEEADRER